MTEKRTIPWLTMILVGGLLFLVGHSLEFTVAKDMATRFGTAAEAIAEGSPRRRVGLFLLGFGGGLVMIVRQPRYKPRLNGITAWLAVGFLAWAALTLFWATDFAIAFRRFVVLCLVTVAMIAALRHWSLREVVLFITLSALAFALIGLAAEVAYGTFQPFSAEYRFSGTQHPNHQGMNLARLVLGAFCLSQIKITGRWFFVAMVVAGLVLLVLTRSRTAFGATLFALAVFVGLRASPLRLMVMLFFAGAIGLLALFLIQNGALSTPWGVILMGRGEGAAETTLTLSGRTEWWRYLWGFIVEQPVRGYGYHSFMSPSRVSQVPSMLAWGINESHSLYIEILLGTGAVGFSLLVGVLLGGFVRAARLARRFRSAEYGFLAAYIVFIILNGVMAATSMFPEPQFVALLVLGYVLLRDPEQEVAGVGPVLNARWREFSVASHRGGVSSTRGWPPVHGGRVPPQYP